jgi:alkanesulfonate monooxygenase SsuD/methylene tetrahydromethanopterin reductase-like flavin-dependent oxidoreductase (luciferase family)
MNVGLAMTARQLPSAPRPLVDIYREQIEQAVLGEELGFYSYRLAEHHFAEDQHNPSQFPLLAAVATHTEELRLGPYVLLLALHDPIRVAEDSATLDILSDGRLDLVIGAGPMPNECAVFGIDRADAFNRTYEALEVIQACFEQDEFSHDGRFFHYEGVRMTTKPIQRPGPPVYMAALGPQSLRRAGARGYNLGSVLHTPLINIYEEAQAAAGRTRADYKLMSGPIAVHLAPTREQAWDECEAGLHWWIGFYRSRGIDMPHPPIGELRDTPGAGIFGMPFGIGTPEDVIEVVAMHRDADIDELVIQFNHPGMTGAQINASMKLFADELLPEIRGWGKAR